MIISIDEFPLIIKAIHCILDDTGNRLRNPVQVIPDRWKDFLSGIEKTLGTLSATERAPESEPLPFHVKPDTWMDSEFYAFCNGEMFEQNAIANRSFEHTIASVFLIDFFEDWTYTSDSARESPANTSRIVRVEWLSHAQSEDGKELSPEEQAELSKLRLELV